MHITCSICSDLVNQAENLCVTKCGHIFHYHCLAQWLERSKSCPECRNKVTDKCMFRLYPNISNETSADDITTFKLQMDDTMLKLREQRMLYKETKDQLISVTADLKNKLELISVTEEKLAKRDIEVSALRHQLSYVQIENKELKRLKKENENLKRDVELMKDLQKVLNATSDDVEKMLHSYSDLKTVATFATALKRALCELESKKNKCNDRLLQVKAQLSAEKNTVSELEVKLKDLQERFAELQEERSPNNKRTISSAFGQHVDKDEKKAKKIQYTELSPPTDDFKCHFPTNFKNDMVDDIQGTSLGSNSPYLSLRQSNLALSTLQQRLPTISDGNIKPSEYAILNAARKPTLKNSAITQSNNSKNSIFQKKYPTMLEFKDNQDALNLTYDGLGGHSTPDVFPVPKTKTDVLKCRIPTRSAKHKLKKPSVASHDIGKMLGKNQMK